MTLPQRIGAFVLVTLCLDFFLPAAHRDEQWGRDFIIVIISASLIALIP